VYLADQSWTQLEPAEKAVARALWFRPYRIRLMAETQVLQNIPFVSRIDAPSEQRKVEMEVRPHLAVGSAVGALGRLSELAVGAKILTSRQRGYGSLKEGQWKDFR
jgi:hypothetical protein